MGATKLVAGEANGAVIGGEGRRGLKAFMRYVRANMEEPVWDSEVIVEGGGCDWQPGQGTMWRGVSGYTQYRAWP